MVDLPVGSEAAKDYHNLQVLLIVFMVVSPQKGLDVRLSESRADAPAQGHAIVLTIEEDGELILNRREVAKRDLSSTLREALETRSDRILFVKASPRLKYRDVVSVIDVARGSGASRIGVLR